MLYQRSSSTFGSGTEDDNVKEDLTDGKENIQSADNRVLSVCFNDNFQQNQSSDPRSDLAKSCTIQEYRNSKPLIKTYHLKMILFSMKLLLVDQTVWTRDNMPNLVLFVLKTLFFVFSSREKCFNNFWFQEMIESSARQSAGLEILQALEDILEDFEDHICC